MDTVIEAQTLKPEGLCGNLLSWKFQELQLEGRLERGFVSVTTWTEGVFRINVRLEETERSNPYSVLSSPDSQKGQWVQHDDYLELESGPFSCRVYKKPFRLEFACNDQSLLADDEGFPYYVQGEHLSTYKKKNKNEHFLGLGEKTGPLDRSGRGYTMWNTDKFGYGTEEDPIYCSIPFYIGVHDEGLYGIYLDNPAKSHFNFGASNNRFSSIETEAGDLDYYVILGDSVRQIVMRYTSITGRMNLPPIWSLGYQQSRYSYYPETEVVSIAETFRNKNIPADVIYFDIHYMENYKVFSWDSQRYPDPGALIARLREMGFQVVVIMDPGIKIEEDYIPYQQGKQQNLFVTYPDQTLYEGEVWPGWCHFPDFTLPAARKWWAKMMECYTEIGISGFWNDMNEIATWGQQLPNLLQFHMEGNQASSLQARNMYGMQMARATHEGASHFLNNTRPFVLTRAGFAGIQRYAAVWTGDNVASDEHMLLGVRMVASMGLSGVPFAGFDVGGFVGETTPELFARWISIGAFCPFFRSHTTINTRDSEPWSFGEANEEIARNYVNLRYRFMPYLYELFVTASETGLPILRSLALDYAKYPEVYMKAFENQFLLGDQVLVAPCKSSERITKVWLPPGHQWYYLHDGKKYPGGESILVEAPLDKLPVFIRSGSILPMQSSVSHTGEQPETTLELHLYAGENSQEIRYYEDDGSSLNYRDGCYFQRQILYAPTSRELVLENSQGTTPSYFQDIKLFFHGFKEMEVYIKGQALALNDESYRFLPRISSFDPLGDQYSDLAENVQTVTFAHDPRKIQIEWKA